MLILSCKFAVQLSAFFIDRCSSVLNVGKNTDKSSPSFPFCFYVNVPTPFFVSRIPHNSFVARFVVTWFPPVHAILGPCGHSQVFNSVDRPVAIPGRSRLPHKLSSFWVVIQQFLNQFLGDLISGFRKSSFVSSHHNDPYCSVWGVGSA